jgi:hypothetical protein
MLALHPTVKPVALIVDAIKDCTSRGDIVLDPFAGSGSTIIAAQKAGRIGYGIELDPRYADTIVRRWQEMTGDNATLDETGASFDDMSAQRQFDQQAKLAGIAADKGDPQWLTRQTRPNPDSRERAPWCRMRLRRPEASTCPRQDEYGNGSGAPCGGAPEGQGLLYRDAVLPPQ